MEEFIYDWSSPAAQAYLSLLESTVTRQKKRRTRFAIAALSLVVIAILIPFFLYSAISFFVFGISGVLIITAGILVTDDVRGRLTGDLVCAAVSDFSKLSEFDIGKFEKASMMTRHDVEEQRLLYCLRISSNLRKLRKIDVVKSRWDTCMEHGAPFFSTTPRGALVADFLSKLYFYHLNRIAQEFTEKEIAAICGLKTAAAADRRRNKSIAYLTEIQSQWPELNDIVAACVEKLNTRSCGNGTTQADVGR